MAVTKLFSSFKSTVNMGDYGSIVSCMKNIPSESQMQVIFLYHSCLFLCQMPLIETATIILGCCTGGPKSSSFWEKKRGPSVCPGRSTLGTCNHTGIAARWYGLFEFKQPYFCNVLCCLTFLPSFHFHVKFIVFSLTVGTVLCGYSEENGSLPFCIGVPSANAMPSDCWTTCRCF